MADLDEKLLPCPFCGGVPVYRRFTGNGFTLPRVEFTQVRCGECRIETEPLQPLTADRALEAWNRRALPSPVTPASDVVEALRAIAEGYPVYGKDDRFVVVQNPNYKFDDGSDPNICIDVASLAPAQGGREGGAKIAGYPYERDGHLYREELTGQQAQKLARKTLTALEASSKQRGNADG